jgi:hypothetical protein
MKETVAAGDTGIKGLMPFLYKMRGEKNSKKLRYPTKKEQ